MPNKIQVNRIHGMDCISGMQSMDDESVHLAFADPPFNIGYEYDVYDDARAAEDYLNWCQQWIGEIYRVLANNGTFWLAIGDEFAAELKLIAQREVGFHCRSWVLWYYTFGVNCARSFSRSHTHLLYFVKDKTSFTFNAHNPAVRVPSARQLVYGDKRANPKGRLPDNTWILRPQDAPQGGFGADQNTWFFPRVAGTFKEREGFHGCQMPEQLLGRIIRSCSLPHDVVMDPFGGSGTTLAVAKKLNRRWLGFELSNEYMQRIEQRLRSIRPGDPLDGAPDPLQSAPKTSKGRKLKQFSYGDNERERAAQEATKVSEHDQTLFDAFRTVCPSGCLDELLADTNLRSALVQECKRRELHGTEAAWNRTLVTARDRGQLGLQTSTTCEDEPIAWDDVHPGVELALHQLSTEYRLRLDDLLCDPHRAAEFDALAESFTPGQTPQIYRRAAQRFRTQASAIRGNVTDQLADWLKKPLPKARAIQELLQQEPPNSALFVVLDAAQLPLYIGYTWRLKQQLERLLELPVWHDLQPTWAHVIPDPEYPRELQAVLAYRLSPFLNSRLIVPHLSDVEGKPADRSQLRLFASLADPS